ncbi:type II CRISPR RNA-guided endonuclease Cas9 [Manganibacter manganicus]|uniref:CRISPR-associated endonuclease Cas9 n=1 Tax=Manganibacter manganicus TaxID=1873176 RepID=A0A1V8RJ55_9HYPH|nr:type II CRISPR RNA-guided endonuclease Cas9 [Pseudaminobacter manganicus]OQM73237.1 type II CRISPR RNA-guided endonuclease Cas9 [Pseudaminobacter manganicus]
MRWRLGADLGTNSLGWAVIELDDDDVPIRVVTAGSRIFSDGRDPKSGASLAFDRRAARAMRRRRDRFKQRQAALLKHLADAGFFPAGETERKALEGLDPFALRANALREKLPLHHLGRALFHLNQRRGFKSNRKADRGKNDDSGKIRVGVGRLHEAMRDAGAETLGDYLHGRRAASADPNTITSVRTRLRPETGEGARGDGYDFYPDRAMLEEEFKLIWERQAPHHPETLTPENEKRFFEIIFHQRPLKQPKIGMCTLTGNEPRLPKAHPLFQRRRLLEEINALRIVRAGANPEPLTLEQRNLLYVRLKDKKVVSFDTLRNKVLKLDPDVRFNKESENRKDIKGDEVAAELGAKARFGTLWQHLSDEARCEVVSRIREQESDEDEAMLLAWLQETHKLAPEQARATVGARLPEGYGRFGETATKKLIEALKAEVIVYSEAVEKAGLGHHSDKRTGEIFTDAKGRPALPYYGVPLERQIMPGTGDPADPEEMRVGRLTNPTVHIGLNQLRRVVNALIRRYGPPEQIAIELARELKLDDKRKQEINAKNRQNRDAAVKRSEKLGEIGIADKGANRALLKLWEELNPANVLDRRCVYTGTLISIDMLFSGAVEVDHILPFSATLDDSNGNRLLCMREANREKRKRSPYDAFGHRTDWEEIAARAARLPREKRWRFEPDAMSRFDVQGGFIARQLVDTQYLSRLAREYLSSLHPDSGEGSSHVWVSPGRLTEMLRRSWGLNSALPDHNFGGGADQPKNRKDHRHHAIDAMVIAVTDRRRLMEIAREAGQHGHESANRMTSDLSEPWEGFSDEVREVVRGIVVSHRPDRGTASKAGLPKGHDATAGRLHNETAYGLTGEKDEKGNAIVVHRVPLTALKKTDDIDAVRDPDLRTALHEWTFGLEGKDFEARLRKFPELGPLPFRNIRRLRVVEPLSVIPIRDRDGRAYKGYKGDSNYRYDVWEMKDGKWQAEVVSMFDAHQPGWMSTVRQQNPTAKKVLSLHRDDLIAVEPHGTLELVRVVKFSERQLALAPPNEAGALKARAADKEDPFNYLYPSPNTLKSWKARQVRIDELGHVSDPGFPARKAKRRKRANLVAAK